MNNTYLNPTTEEILDLLLDEEEIIAKHLAFAAAQKLRDEDEIEEEATEENECVTRFYRCRECGYKDPDGVEVELFFKENAPKGYVHGIWFCPECCEEYYDNIRLQARDGVQRP